MDQQEHADALNRLRTEKHFDFANQRKQDTAELARLGLKTLTVLNGGAIISIFTLLGHIDVLGFSPAWLTAALATYLFGVFAAIVAMFFGFAGSNGFWLVEALAAETVYRDSQGAAPHGIKPGWMGDFAIWFWGAAVAFAFLSLLAFGAGSVLAVSAVGVKAHVPTPACAQSAGHK